MRAALYGITLTLALAVCGCSGETPERAATGTAGAAPPTEATSPDRPTVSVVETTVTDTASIQATTTAAEATPPDQRPLPTSADELTIELNAAELAVRNASPSLEEQDSWGRRQQTLYRHLANNRDWAKAVLTNADPAIAEAVSLNWEARENLAALLQTESLHDELPAWRVLPPLPAETLIEYYKRGEAEWGIRWEFLAAINLIETRMGRIQGVSTAGAVGPMQFLPTTWAECCEGDPTNPADAIVGAAKYLTIRGGPQDMDRAIWGYNNSDHYVNAVKAYARVLMADERAYYGYHAWEIYFLSTEGLVRIPVGYEQLEPIAVTEWLADNPEALFSR